MKHAHTINYIPYPGSMRGWEGSAGTSVRDPETQEGARESLKSPKALAIDV
jgi:hypothetical protein